MSANKLSTAQEYVRSNYIGTGRLRYDLLAGKLQIAVPRPPCGLKDRCAERPQAELAEGPANAATPERHWQDLDTRWINTMAVECANETGVSVSDKEIRIVLNSHVVPAINPLRDWLLSLDEYTPSSVSFIDWLSSQVHVVDKGVEEEGSRGVGSANEERQRVLQRSGLSANEESGLSAVGGLSAQRSSNAVWQLALRSGSWRWWRVGCMTR